MRHYQIAVLPGDGIGPEVITESVKTLEALAELHAGFHLDTQYFDWGTERYLHEGAMMPKDGLAVLERGGFDGILLGPIGDPRVPDHLTLWGLLLPLRQGFDQYVNLRPCTCYQACGVLWQTKVPPRLIWSAFLTCLKRFLRGHWAHLLLLHAAFSFSQGPNVVYVCWRA